MSLRLRLPMVLLVLLCSVASFGQSTSGSITGAAAITNNLRGGPVEGSNRPLGQFFGEYNGARDPRIIQLAVKINF